MGKFRDGLLLVGILTIISIDLFSQNIGLNYNSVGSGRNVTGTLSKEFAKSEFGIGLGYNINRIKQPDDQANIYYKRLFATKPIQYLNVEFFLIK